MHGAVMELRTSVYGIFTSTVAGCLHRARSIQPDPIHCPRYWMMPWPRVHNSPRLGRFVLREASLRSWLAGEPDEHGAGDQESREESNEREPADVQELFPWREAIAAGQAEQLARPPH